MTTDTNEPTVFRLAFGYNDALIPGLRAVWGARWIVTQDGRVDVVHDRTDWRAPDGESARLDALSAWLNDPAPNVEPGEPDASPFRQAVACAARLLRDGVIHTREQSPTFLYQDRAGVIVANTNASAGYLYVAGWRFEDVPAGHPTRGMERVIEAIQARRAAIQARQAAS